MRVYQETQYSTWWLILLIIIFAGKIFADVAEIYYGSIAIQSTPLKLVINVSFFHFLSCIHVYVHGAVAIYVFCDTSAKYVMSSMIHIASRHYA